MACFYACERSPSVCVHRQRWFFYLCGEPESILPLCLHCYAFSCVRSLAWLEIRMELRPVPVPRAPNTRKHNPNLVAALLIAPADSHVALVTSGSACFSNAIEFRLARPPFPLVIDHRLSRRFLVHRIEIRQGKRFTDPFFPLESHY